jgi:SHS family lactate transporter-like MFS transporter
LPNAFNRHHGSEFEKHKAAFEEGGGDDDAYVQEDVLPRPSNHGITEETAHRGSGSFDDSQAEKPEVKTIEKV